MANRELLRAAMAHGGFHGISHEWCAFLTAETACRCGETTPACFDHSCAEGVGPALTSAPCTRCRGDACLTLASASISASSMGRATF